jgi:integrase
MPRPKSKRPAYRLYKPKDLAVVRIDGKDHYLGKYGSDESYERYHRLLAESLAGSVSTAAASSGDSFLPPPLTISELIWQYWLFAQAYYRKNDAPTSEQHCIRSALRPLRRLFGRTAVSDFGPKSLKLVHDDMIAAGLCRTTINKYVHRIKRMFAWAVEQELLDVRIYQSLATVRGLAKGRTDAIEPMPVRPVTLEQVDAVLAFLSPTLRAMVQFQRLTGCRPSEVCMLRSYDVDRTGPVWCYEPASHKTEHQDLGRRIFVGPAAQEILQPFLNDDPAAYCFSPRRSAGKNGGKLSANRRPGERYTSASYRPAICRACEVAFGMPDELRNVNNIVPAEERRRLDAEAVAWRKRHCWAPNQLRHLRATEIRTQFGLEASQTVLGHTTADTTQIYAERDWLLAERIAGATG